jgi:hypothetical protein
MTSESIEPPFICEHGIPDGTFGECDICARSWNAVARAWPGAFHDPEPPDQTIDLTTLDIVVMTQLIIDRLATCLVSHGPQADLIEVLTQLGNKLGMDL